MTTEPMFLTASQLSRRADVPISKVWKVIHSGLLQPDCQPNPNLMLFHMSKVADLKSLARQN